MADEIVSVGIKIEATGADKAASQLDALATKGAKVEASTGKIEAGAAKAGKSLESMGGSANSAAASSERLAQAGQKLGTAFAAASAALGVGQLIQTSDAYTKLTAQLRLATTGQTEYANAYANVSRIATAAQSDLAGTAVLYARITSATRELGVAQSQVAAITETVSLALKVSGAGAAESASAMLQLSQAFASGVLRGEEFNAVNEAAPRLMKALADGIGVSVGALRGLAEQGKLTSELLATALPKALEGLRGEAKEVENIAGAFTLLKNSFTEFVGQQSQASGAAALLAQGIGLVAKNLDLVAAAALGYAGAKVANLLLQTGAAAASSTAALLQQAAAQNAAKAAAVQAAQAQTATAAANIATANATQVAIVSARADAVAQLERANATLAASRASIAAATAAGAQSAALAVLRGASIAAAEADTARAAAMSALAVLGRQQASVTTQLAAANTALVASQTATAAAAAGAAGAATLASRALTLLGGPIGVITTLLGVGVTAWFAWGAAAKSGEQSAAGAMEKSTGEIISALDSQIAKLKERNALAAGGVPSIAKGNDESSQRAAALFSQAQRVQRGELNPELDAAGRGQFVQDLLRQYGELVTKISTVRTEQQKLDDTGKRSKLSEYMTKYATSAESAAAAIKKAREELGSAFTPELERRIREHFIKPVKDGADKAENAAREQEAKSYEAIVKSLLGVQAKYAEEVENTSDAQKVLNKAIAEGEFANLPENMQAAIKAVVEYTERIQRQSEAVKERAAAFTAMAESDAALQAQREQDTGRLIEEADSVAAQTRALKEETKQTGLTAVQIAQLTITRGEELILIKQAEEINARSAGRAADADAIRRQVLELERLNQARRDNLDVRLKTDAGDRAKAALASNKIEATKAADDIGRAITDSLFRAAEAGKGFFESLRNSLKGMFNNLVLQPSLKLAYNSITSGAGGGGLGSLASAGQSFNGGFNSLFNSAAMSGIGERLGLSYNPLGEAGATALTGLGQGIQTALPFLASIAQAAQGNYATAALSAIGTAIAGPIGTVIGTVLGSFIDGDRGGPKGGGSFSSTGERLFSPNASDAQLATIGASLSTSIASALTSFGATSTGLQFGVGFDTDPQGKADNRIASFLRDANGNSILDNTAGRNVGRDDARLQTEIATETKRLMLAALQAVGPTLENGFGEIFARLDPAQAAPEAIDSLFNLAEQLRGLGEAAKDLPGVMGDVADLSATAREQLIGFAGGLEQLSAQQGTYYSEFFTAQEQLNNSQRVLTGRFADIGLSFDALQANAAGPRQAFRALVEGLDLTTESGRQSYTALLALAGPLDQFLDGIEALPEGLSITSQALTEFADKTDDAAKAIDNSAKLIEGLEGQIAGLENVFGDIRGAMADISPAADTLVDAWRRGRDEIDAIRQALGLNGGATGVTALIQRLTSGQALESTFATARASIQDQIFEARLRGMKPEDQVSALRAQEGALWQQLGSSGDKAGVVAQIERVVLRWQSLERDIAQASAQGNADAQYRAAVELQRLEKQARDEQITLLGKQSNAWKEQLSAAERMRDFARDIGSFAQSLRIGDLSPLSPRERIAEARSAFQRNAAGAAAGDQFAQQNLQGSASEFLTQLRQFFGSSGEFVQGFGEVQAALGGISGVNVDPQIELLNRQVSQVDAQIEYLRGIEDAAIEQQRIAADTSAAEVAALSAIDAALAAGQNYAANEVKAVADVLRETLRISVEANTKREAEIVRLSGEIARMEAALRAIATNTAGTAQNTYDISNAVSQGEFVGPVRSPVVALT